MTRPSLAGRSFLIVENEPLIVMDILRTFEHTGAEMTTTDTLRHAMIIVEYDGLSGAILDHALPDGDSSFLCARLKDVAFPSSFTAATDRVTWRARFAMSRISRSWRIQPFWSR
jgi:DNA-binding response OmpR family regulator